MITTVSWTVVEHHYQFVDPKDDSTIPDIYEIGNQENLNYFCKNLEVETLFFKEITENILMDIMLSRQARSLSFKFEIVKHIVATETDSFH